MTEVNSALGQLRLGPARVYNQAERSGRPSPRVYVVSFTDWTYAKPVSVSRASGLWTQVINGRNLADIAVVDTLNNERVLDGLVLDFRVFSSDGALQDADTLGILVENGLDVLRLPKRILWSKVSQYEHVVT